MSESPILDRLSARAPPRYTSFALPSYRFVPRRSPHPTTDPRGHSYERPPPFEVAPMDGYRWWESPAYLYGCDLYNRGFWWEAHEAWEAVWQLADKESPERAGLQGLIQLANCHLKLHMGRPKVIPRLQERYSAHFDRVMALADRRFLGLDLPHFRAQADAYVLHLAAYASPVHDPRRYPFLNLQSASAPA